jgi:hypothetical protein
VRVLGYPTKEKAKEKLRRDFKKLKTALEAFELEVKG